MLKLVNVHRDRNIGKTNHHRCLSCPDFRHWKHNVKGSNQEREAGRSDRDRRDENTREISDGVSHLAYNEADLYRR